MKIYIINVIVLLLNQNPIECVHFKTTDEFLLNNNTTISSQDINNLNNFILNNQNFNNPNNNLTEADIIGPLYYDYELEKSQEEFNSENDLQKIKVKAITSTVAAPTSVVSTLKLTPTVAEARTNRTDVITIQSLNTAPDIYPDPDILIKLNNELPLKNDVKTQYNNNNKINHQEVNNEIHDEMINENFDKDLKGHDLIDNIMYIYYGSNSVIIRKGLGGNIIVIGSVFGLAAQILTIALSYLRNRRLRRINNALFPIAINLLLMLCTSNFIFIIGVQSAKNPLKCEIIAVLLHYLHLSTSLWGLIYVITIYQFISNEFITNLKKNYLLAYLGPGAYVMISYAFSNETYETQKYCWMSIQRGMIVNFMIPASILIITSTILGTICLRKIIAKQREIIGESIESFIDSVATKYEVPTNTTIGTNSMENTCAQYGCMENQTECNEKQEQIPDQLNEDCIQNNEQQHNDNNCNLDSGFANMDSGMIKSKLDLYDSKFNLAALSLADLSLQSISDIQDYADFKKAIRVSLFFEPTFSVCWFLGVIALENSQISCIMPVIFFIFYNIMNWSLLTKISIIYPMINIKKPSASISTTTSTSFHSGLNNFNNNNQINNCNLTNSNNFLYYNNNNNNNNKQSKLMASKPNLLLLNERTQLNDSPNSINNAKNTNGLNGAKCSDTIPLLCSTSSGLNNIININKNKEISQHYNWETANVENTNKTISTNLDCISTISS